MKSAVGRDPQPLGQLCFRLRKLALLPRSGGSGPQVALRKQPPLHEGHPEAEGLVEVALERRLEGQVEGQAEGQQRRAQQQ